jgi:hypothetical protein
MSMTITQMKLCWPACFLAFCMQSLMDIAREEAERRRLLEEQGIEAKVIDGRSLPDGNVSTFTSSASTQPKDRPKESPSPKGSTTLRTFRNSLQKLDRTILESEARLDSRRDRLQSQHWELLKSGRGSGEKSQERLKEEIADLEMKLKRLRQERSEVYGAGRKAGYLPGELDGKGIIP